MAAQLDAFAAMLELAGANRYFLRAYRRAAETIRSLPVPVTELVEAGRVRELRGIGPSIAARVEELVATGRIVEIERLERLVRPDLAALGQFLGLTPARMLEIAKQLDVSSADEFRAAARSGRLRQVTGIGSVREARILDRLETVDRPSNPRPLLLSRARTLLDELARPLAATVAGDVRRWHDEPRHLVLVAASDDGPRTIETFVRLVGIVAIVVREERRCVGLTLDGNQVELVVASSDRFGTELVQQTGSDAYVRALGPLPDAASEEELYGAIGLPWCPPELRETPLLGEPPRLVEIEQIRGDLHCHTIWSDGRASIGEMAEAAICRGYSYIAICDHTTNVRVVPGLDADGLRRQGDEVNVLNEQLAPFRILRGSEVDIRSDGTLDLPDDVLAELDWVQLSLHAGQREPGERLTRKVTEAMRHPAVRCLSHPTGRIVNHRPSNALDLGRVIEVALETGVALEVNGLPDRLDLSGEHARLAIEAGVSLAVSTDAHSIRGLDNMELAVATARRGQAPPELVVNTREVDELLRRQ